MKDLFTNKLFTFFEAAISNNSFERAVSCQPVESYLKISKYCQILKEPDILEGPCYALFCYPACFLPDKVFAIEHNTSFRGGVDPRNDIKNSCFSSSIGTDQCNDLS